MSSAQLKIDAYINSLSKWKRDLLHELRVMIHELNPHVVEQWKWSRPVFVVDETMRISMSAFLHHVKYNFHIVDRKYKDPHKLLNNGFSSVHFRSIDIKEGESLNKDHLRDLVRQFVVDTPTD